MKHAGIKIKRWLIRSICFHTADIRFGYLGAAFMLAIAITVRALSGSPYRIWVLLQSQKLMPPIALLMFINLLFTAAIGFACGLVLSDRRRGICCKKYQGGMFFIFAAVLWFLVYPLVFRGGVFLGATLLLLFVWLLSFGCIWTFTRIQKIAGWIFFFYLLWLTYLIVLSICIILCI